MKNLLGLKGFLIFCMCMAGHVCMYAQKPGDYMEIGGVPAFVFYVDDSGHGLAMSAAAVTPEALKTLERQVKKGRVTKEQAEMVKGMNVLDIKGYAKAGKLKADAKKKLFEGLIPALGDKGEENAKAIEAYCKARGLSLEEEFPWQYWASQLGEGWYIPGDYELELFARFFMGGLDKEYGMGVLDMVARAKELADNEVARGMVQSIVMQGGLMSSTAKHSECGFRILCRVERKLPTLLYWYELLDEVRGTLKEENVQTCAVHEF